MKRGETRLTYRRVNVYIMRPRYYKGTVDNTRGR